MLRSCKHCGRIHDRNHDCGKKPKRARRFGEHDKFRNTKAWQRKREHIRQRDLYLCQMCRANGRYKSDGLEVHHITPLVEDFEQRLDDENLITLCGNCHEKAERGEITREHLRGMIAG
ncbi:MAG: HNH endonuclease [Defluviitaleaceae bacterium]|nr:HNH endonuclease [Defluviitaleaceae bacterium]MCL2263788.1 HNH endonuclease [Defluviitaleaceae bacterium]